MKFTYIKVSDSKKDVVINHEVNYLSNPERLYTRLGITRGYGRTQSTQARTKKSSPNYKRLYRWYCGRRPCCQLFS